MCLRQMASARQPEMNILHPKRVREAEDDSSFQELTRRLVLVAMEDDEIILETRGD